MEGQTQTCKKNQIETRNQLLLSSVKAGEGHLFCLTVERLSGGQL